MCCSCSNGWGPCADEFGTLLQKPGLKSVLHHVWRTWCISSAFPLVFACLCGPIRITQFHSIWWIVLEFWGLTLLDMHCFLEESVSLLLGCISSCEPVRAKWLVITHNKRQHVVVTSNSGHAGGSNSITCTVGEGGAIRHALKFR